MKANFRLDLTPNHPEEQTDGSPPPPPPDPIPGNVNPESNSACLLQASQFCAAAFVWLKNGILLNAYQPAKGILMLIAICCHNFVFIIETVQVAQCLNYIFMTLLCLNC